MPVCSRRRGEAEPIGLLIVDDHQTVRDSLCAVLADDPRFSVTGAAADGREALALAERTRPGAAIVDLQLPTGPGDELCRDLRRLLPQIAVVVFSATAREAAQERALEAGALAYVPKTAGLPALRQALDQVWRGAGLST